MKNTNIKNPTGLQVFKGDTEKDESGQSITKEKEWRHRMISRLIHAMFNSNQGPPWHNSQYEVLNFVKGIQIRFSNRKG